MSINQKQLVKCPKCGELHEIVVWSSITVSDSEDLKKDLLAGKVNILRCHICDQVALLPNPILYHDEAKKLMISFTPCVEEKVKEELFTNLKENSKKNKELENFSDYNLRFITDYNDFLEKILIFDNDLHDKVIELIKLLVLAQEPEKAEKRIAVFGKIENDEMEFLIRDMSDGMCYTSRVPLTTYDTLYDELKKSGVKYKSFNWEEVNPDYASKLLSGLNN